MATLDTRAAPHRGPPGKLPAGDTSHDLAAVVRPMPRRQKVIDTTTDPSAVPRLRSLKFKAGTIRSLRRFATWLWLIAYVLGGNLVDRLRGRDSLARRAFRLRRGLEKAGGTLVKLGQQVAMRIDLVPWEYCVELSKMLDRMPAFDVADAIAAIERATGRPWQDVFAVLDPQPVGSASIACVYQGILKDGTKVAVKVRRPGIGEVFTADLRVIDWIVGLAERLTIVRPGSTRNVRKELRETLLEELDFRKEARYQDIFRRNARKKAGKRFFTAPRVHFELSDDAVLVQEFVSGLWLWEVIGAIEQNDTQGLLAMQELGIDPAILARRILWVIFWSGDENLFFHADPHPANIVVGRDNTLTFVDFGSCGSFDEEQRWALEHVVVSMRRGDAAGMAKGALKLLEPLQPVDVAALAKDLESEYMRMLVTFRTKKKYTEWWERTSARMWLGMVRTARRHRLQLNLHTLRMIRATLLYDTLVLRLDPRIDRFEEYARFRVTDRARWARQRWNQRMRGLRRDLPLVIEALADTGDDLLSNAHHALSSPVLLLRSTVDKWAYAMSVLSRMTGQLLLVTGASVAAVALAGLADGGTVAPAGLLGTVLQSGAYRVVVAGIVFLHVRRIMFRLADLDSQAQVRVSGEPLRS